LKLKELRSDKTFNRELSLTDYFFLFFFKLLKNFTQLNGFRNGFVTGWNLSFCVEAH
jgi:hypothetical protein